MKLFSKKPAEAKSGASGAASTEPLSAERADEILREYSPEDNERQLTKWVARVVNVFSLFISLFLVYTAAFGQLPDLKSAAVKSTPRFRAFTFPASYRDWRFCPDGEPRVGS